MFLKKNIVYKIDNKIIYLYILKCYSKVAFNF